MTRRYVNPKVRRPMSRAVTFTDRKKQHNKRAAKGRSWRHHE